MSKHYIVRLRDTELWVSSTMEFQTYGGTKYHPHLVKDPIQCNRYDTYEEAEKFAKKHVPEEHWVIHQLIPRTELREKPLFDVSEATPALDALGAKEVGPKCMPVCGDKRNAWCRFWNCGE